MTDRITTKPIRSQAQWRFLFGTGKPFARRWAHETPGGPKQRFQRLPVKVTKKAPNYGARAGQTIAGRLRRGSSGRFESAGGPGAQALNAARDAARQRKPGRVPAPKRGGGKRPAKTEAQRAQERQQRQQERAQQRAAEREQHIAATFQALGLAEDAADSLKRLAAGEAVDDDGGLVALGLAEQARDGSYRLTATGRAVMNAAERGDTGAARDAASRARDRVAAQNERQAAGMTRAMQTAATPKPKKGGGGGKKKKPEKKPVPRLPSRSSRAPQRAQGGGGSAPKAPKAPEQKPELPQNLVDAARALSEGRTTNVELLIRNGLARRDKQGRVVLTAAGLRAIREKAYTPARTTDAGHTGVMAALYPDAAAAKAIAAQDGVTEPLDQLHLTLCYLGDSTEQPLATNKEKVIAAIDEWAQQHGQPLKGQVNGLGRFFHSESDGTDAVYVSPDVPGLPEARQSLADWIEASGFDYSQDHGFTPHITVAYVPEDASTPPIRVETPISFDHVTLAWGDERYEFPLGYPDQSQFAGHTMEDWDDTLPDSHYKSTFAVYKDASGALRWVAYSSNAYRDRDQEIVSTKALEEDCRRADKDGSYGPLRWWHVGGPSGPGWDLGTCDFNAMHGRVLIESGTFKSAAIGQAVAKAAPQLQLSIGFTHAPSEPDRDGVFHHIRRFERSLVPIGRAANPFTRLIVKETRMDTEKETALKGALGEEVAAEVLKGAEVVQKDADAQGIAYKADDPWAAVLTALKGAVAAMVPAPPAEPEPVAEKAEPPAEAKAEPMDMGGDVVEEDVTETVDETDPGEMTYDEFVSEIRRVVREELAAELKAQLAPLAGMMDIEKKVSGAVQSLMQPYQAQKDASDAERQAEITSLKARLTELEGDVPNVFRQPFVGYRPSQAADTVVTKGDAPGGAVPALNPAQPTDDDPFADIKAGLFGTPTLNGHTPGV